MSAKRQRKRVANPVVKLADIPDLIRQRDALTAKLRFYDELADELLCIARDVMVGMDTDKRLASRRAAAERRLNVLRGQLELFE